jgi:hypothetical protein
LMQLEAAAAAASDSREAARMAIRCTGGVYSRTEILFRYPGDLDL